jgi:hypothetical protein
MRLILSKHRPTPHNQVLRIIDPESEFFHVHLSASVFANCPLFAPFFNSTHMFEPGAD